MRAWTMAVALPLLFVPTMASAQGKDSTVAERGRELAHSTAAEAARRFNQRAALRATGSLTIPADQIVSGDVAVLDGPLTIAGTVQGSVVVVNGDVVLERGAKIEGDLMVVGGVIDGERAATIGGTVTSDPAPMRYRRDGNRITPDEDSGVRSFVRRMRRTTSRIRLTAGGYNRVEGLPVIAGPAYRERTDWGSIRVEALGIWRSANQFEWTPRNLGHDALAEVQFGSRRGVAIGGRLYDVVNGVESWHLGDSEVALASFFAHRDFRDYYGRHGARGYVRLLLSRDFDMTLGFSRERWGSRDILDPFTLFRNDESWRANPLMDEGLFNITTASATYDTRNDLDDPWSGWLIRADVERGSSDAARRAPLTPLARSEPGGTVAPLTYSRGFLDVRRYNRVSPEGQLNFRLVLGGTLGGDPLPAQKRLSIGGPGTLPGFDFRRAGAGDDPLTCTEDLSLVDPVGPLPQGRPAQCERIALLQVEYRGDLRIGIGGVDPEVDREEDREGWHKFSFHHVGQWVVFADAGRGWLVGPQRTGLQYHGGDIPALSSFRSDLGAGLDFDVIGFFIAKSTSQRNEPANFFVRLRHRF